MAHYDFHLKYTQLTKQNNLLHPSIVHFLTEFPCVHFLRLQRFPKFSGIIAPACQREEMAYQELLA